MHDAKQIQSIFYLVETDRSSHRNHIGLVDGAVLLLDSYIKRHFKPDTVGYDCENIIYETETGQLELDPMPFMARLIHFDTDSGKLEEFRKAMKQHAYNFVPYGTFSINRIQTEQAYRSR